MEPIYNRNELLQLYRVQMSCSVMFYLPDSAYITNELLKFNIQARIDVLKLRSPKNSLITLDTIKQLKDYLLILYCNIDELPLYQDNLFDEIVKFRFEIGK